MFKNRLQAGELLVPRLKQYKDNPNVVVIGLPRGGVVTAFAVAQGLRVPLDVMCLRKIGAPFNSELAIGAVNETGKGYFNEELIAQLGITQRYVDEIVNREKRLAQHRLNLYKNSRPALSLEDKTVILVDDGLATGATMRAAIISTKASCAARVILAVPVGPPDTIAELSQEVDEVICLETPFYFSAVGQFYRDFAQTEDQEVIELLNKCRNIELHEKKDSIQT